MDSQRGWRRCVRCHGVFHEDSPGLTCVDGSMHDWPTSWEYKAPWGDVGPGCQPGWGRCTTCGGLAYRGNVGVCAGGAPHTFDEFDAGYHVPFQDVPGITLEPGWRWCSKCQRLWLPRPDDPPTDDRQPDRCFEGGDHDATGSLEYRLPVADLGLQRDWAWCSTCQGLVRFGADGCADGGQHTTSTSPEYRVAFGGRRESDQQGWCYCRLCHRLVFGDEGGVCAAGGAHALADTLPYTLPHQVEPPDAQPGWRWCRTCQALGYTGSGVGPCPGGDLHDVSGSGAYSLWRGSLDHGQPGWRRCARCRSLVLAAVTDGPCRDGNSHDVADSPAYEASEGGVDVGEEGSFAWCHRCQALVHGGPASTGVCFDGVPHDMTESRVYGVPRDNPPESAEPGWRICSRCAQLFLLDPAGTSGVCVDGTTGAGHDATGSPELLVATLPPPVPDVTVPTLVLTESEALLAVDGSGFPATTDVEVSFVVASATTAATVSTGADGGFRLELAPVVAAPPSGGFVLAKAAGEVIASGRLTRFVPAPPDPEEQP